MTPENMLAIANALLQGGLPLALVLFAVAALGIASKSVGEWLLAERTRRQKRREALITAYVEIALHTDHAKQFVPGPFLDSIIAKIRQQEMERYPGSGRSRRFRPFVAKPKNDDAVQKRLYDGLFWLEPVIIRQIRAWERSVMLEEIMVSRMQSDEFEMLDTERKVGFFKIYSELMLDVVKFGQDALDAMECHADFRLIRSLKLGHLSQERVK
jgi:hypothetical protein